MKEDQSQSAMIERVDKLTETISAWIQRAEEVSLRRYWAIGRAGENVQIPNFPPKTIYVDNSQNANAINIRLDGEIGVYAIPASGTGYVPCEGVHSIGIEGTGICYLLFINRDIRMVSNNQAFSLSGGLGSSSSDPLFASLTGSNATDVSVTATRGSATDYQESGGSVSASSSVTFFDTGVGVTAYVEALTLVSDYNGLNLQVLLYNSSGGLMQYGNTYANASTQYSAGINVSSLLGLADSLFAIIENNAAGIYKVGLAVGKSIYAPNGFKIVAQNTDTVSHNWRANVLYTQQ